jgi:tyrosine-protein kinase Etk/Wzc
MNTAFSRALDLSFLRNRRAQKHVLAATFALGVVGFLVGTFATKMYRSTVTVVPAGQQKSGVAGLLGTQMSGLAGALDGAGGADIARIAAVLRSTAVTDAVIEKFDLKKRYGQKFQEGTRNALWSRCDLVSQPKPNMVSLTCEDQDPVFARDMLVFFAEHGNQVFRRVNSGSASEEVRFLERRVAELRQQADDAAARMRQFQETHQIVDLESQAKAVVSSVAALDAQRIAKQMELDYTRRYSSADESAARQLGSQLSVIDEQLRNLEETRDVPSAPRADGGARRPDKGGMFPAALSVPKLRAEFEKLFRDRKVAEATLVYALERLEGARANEARDVSTFQVLDPPTVADRHHRPIRTFVALLFAAVGFAGAVAYEWLKRPR